MPFCYGYSIYNAVSSFFFGNVDQCPDGYIYRYGGRDHADGRSIADIRIENDIEECARYCMDVMECNSFEYNGQRCILHPEPWDNGPVNCDDGPCFTLCLKDGN